MADECISDCSTDSIDSEIEPQAMDLQDGDFSCINKDMLNILSVNVNSITKEGRVDELEVLAHELNLDIICVQESKHSNEIPENLYSIKGYNLEEKPRSRHGGGLITYIRQDIPYQRVLSLESNEPRLEHLCIDVTINKLKYCISNMYRPPNDCLDDRVAFNSEVEKILKKIKSHRAHTKTVLSDLNLGNIYNFHGGLQHKTLDDTAPDIFLSNNLYQLVDIPTRRVGLSCSLLDLIFINKTENVVSTAVLPPVADHSCTLLSLNTLTFKKPPIKVMKYDYEAADWDKIKDKVTKICSSDIFNCEDINTMTIDITNNLKGLLDHVPASEITLNEKDQPWFSNEVRRKLRKRNRAFNNFKKINNHYKSQSGEGPNGELQDKVLALHKEYKKKSDDYKYCARRAKEIFFKELNRKLHNPEITPGKKFKLLNRLMNTGKNSYIPPIIEDGEVVNDPKEKADIFMKQFEKKSKLPGRLDDAPVLEPKQTISILSGFNTSPHEIGPLIKDLKMAEHSPCGIPSKLLKLTYEKAGSKLTGIISKLLNKIFDKGEFPECWKLANVTPVYKRSGPRTDKGNYRPISILPTLSKVGESIIHGRLLDHLMYNKLISEKQSAYLRGDSTSQQLLYITHKIRKSWAEGKLSHAVFLDISAAFDGVWHKGLLAKLKQNGITDKALELLESYLNRRRATTVIDNIKSAIADLEAGVPQGSRLGPILFLLYIDDIIDGLETDPSLFADDTNLVATGEDTTETSMALNRDLLKIETWAARWKVKFNAKKSKDLIFSHKKLNNSPPILLHGQPIDRVGSHKHLGLTLQPDLNFSQHLENVIKHAYLKMATLFNARLLNRKTLDLLYKLHVRSKIDYCLQVYGPTLNRTQIAQLERVQYKAARLVTKTMKSTSREKLLIDLGWETIAQRIDFLSICHFHKMVTGNTRERILECLPPRTNLGVNLRNMRAFEKYPYTARIRHKFLDKSFFPRTASMWDNLPKEIRLSPNMEEFKLRLSDHIKPKKLKILSYGSKYGNSIHTQLRLGQSQLNSHLHKVGISSTTQCLCGHNDETTNHFLHACTLYTGARNHLHDKLSGLLGRSTTSFNRETLTQILLYGVEPDNPEQYRRNKSIFWNVQHFLIKTKRLCYKSKLQFTLPTQPTN